MPKAKLASDNTLMFWCPGCEKHHGVRINKPGSWTWNGSLEAPVIQPSILVRSGHYAPSQPNDGLCWCNYEERYGEPAPFKCCRCHSYVGSADGSTPGRIQFLTDCTHALAGQTIELPDIE